VDSSYIGMSSSLPQTVRTGDDVKVIMHTAVLYLTFNYRPKTDGIIYFGVSCYTAESRDLSV